MTARSRFRAALLSLLLAALVPATGLAWPAAAQAPKQELTVSAAVSLKDVLDEISHLYRSQNPEAVVRFNLGGSGTLQRQIEEGAPVDIFISASEDDMDKLASKALLLSGTRKDLVKNSIVLIVPNAKTGIDNFQDLAKPEVKIIAIGEPQTVPAGKYAQETLTHLGLYDRLKPKLVLGKDVRQVLTYVATGNADAGIVYATDARTSQQVRVVATAPDESHSPVIYPLAVITASKNPAAAKGFETFLTSSKASAIFQKYGFITVNQ
jgi:molybdate transport system substrate-binding protein